LGLPVLDVMGPCTSWQTSRQKLLQHMHAHMPGWLSSLQCSAHKAEIRSAS
jgi:hypothetical protein